MGSCLVNHARDDHQQCVGEPRYVARFAPPPPDLRSSSYEKTAETTYARPKVCQNKLPEDRSV